jgi:eukaryotic-like serine/threonine-protein kinase
MPSSSDPAPRSDLTATAAGSAPTLASAEPEAALANTLAAELDPLRTLLAEGSAARSLVGEETPVPPVDTAGLDGLDETFAGRRYERGPLLGTGGMGEVRLHVDRRIGRRIAQKTCHASMDSATARQRFVREVRVQGQLEHPAVVPVYDLGVDEDGRVYFTMKRVHGETLEHVIERLAAGDAAYERRFGTRRLLSAFVQVCLAVHYAHTRQVLHRDLKPANVMLGSYGEVYVLDWGLAKVIGEPPAPGDIDADAPDRPVAARDLGEVTAQDRPLPLPDAVVGASGSLTVGGALLGTLAYMAPEQLFRRTHKVDARADVYALGSILFEILTLSRVRPKPDLREVLRAAMEGDEVRPSARKATVPPELDELCARALSTSAEDRPSARDLAEAVQRHLDGDHDLALRRELSARHAASARKRIEGSAEGGGAARVEALREAMKALALDGDNADAQRLLLELLTDVSGAVPEAARPELDAEIGRSRAHAARTGARGLMLWGASLPLALFIGVKSWLAIGASAVALGLAILLARRMARSSGVGSRDALLLASVVAAVVALTSVYLGPFTLVSTCAGTAALLFATAANKRERPLIAAIFSVGSLLPFLAEIFGVFPRAYAFEPGRILVFERAVALPEGPTMGAMMYSTLSFVVLATILVGSMRDALSASEQRQFLQAWYLRQLFPAAKEGAARPAPSP